MKTKIVTDVFGQPHLISLQNILHIFHGGGVYNSEHTNVFINYGFDQIVSIEIDGKDLLKTIQDIQKDMENDV